LAHLNALGLAVDILEFLARSEWPLIVGGAILLFRRPIQELIARTNVTKVDAWGLKAEFEKGLDKVETLTPPREEKPKPKIAMDEKIPSEEPRLLRIPHHGKAASPEAVVLDVWSWLEADMRAMIDAIRPRNVGTLLIPPLKIDEAARELGLSDDDVESLMTLRRLRNKVAHSTETLLTWDDAERFREATVRLLAQMKTHWDERRKNAK
jgi:hypothetical protein